MNQFPSILESVQDLNREQVDNLFQLSQKIEQTTDKTNFLSQKTPLLVNVFWEASTRTRLSFEVAMQRLGGRSIDLDASLSSLTKGEDIEETFLTIQAQGADILVVRTSTPKLLTPFKEHPPVRIINGGDGANQHPTQALTDFYTLWKTWKGELEGKTMAIIGDCYHSRVANSLIDAAKMFGLNLVICGPKAYWPKEAKVIETTEKMQEVLGADTLYMLRVQNERHQSEAISKEDYIQHYGLRKESVKPGQLVLHPGPINIGVELDKDILRTESYYGYQQVQNSIPIRMSIIQSMLLNKDKSVGLQEGFFTPQNSKE